MLIFLALKAATLETVRHPVRSLVSIAAVALGVFALVASMGIVTGLVRGLTEYIETTGGYGLVRVYETAIAESIAPSERHWKGLGGSDYALLRRSLPEEVRMAPEIGFNIAPLTSGDRKLDTFVVGATPDYFPVNRFEVEEGRALTESDVLAASPVIVLSPEAREKLFPGEPAIGREVNFAGLLLKVVGVIREYSFYTGPVKGRGVFKNRFSLIPITLAQAAFYRNEDIFTGVNLAARNLAGLAEFKAHVEGLTAQLRDGKRDLTVQTREPEIEGWLAMERATRMGLALFSALVLAVSGLGIANTMLASIKDRVKEIGVRRATGATKLDMTIQFLVEACFLSLCGGAIGVVTSWGAMPMMARWLPAGFPGAPVFITSFAVLGLLSSIVVGVLAGLFPALRAAKLSPLEALRTA
jgi:putative ABC transport system permease protein